MAAVAVGVSNSNFDLLSTSFFTLLQIFPDETLILVRVALMSLFCIKSDNVIIVFSPIFITVPVAYFASADASI